MMESKNDRRRKLILAAVAALHLLSGGIAQAGQSWQGGGSDTNFTTGGNWDGGSNPASGSGNSLWFLNTNGNYTAQNNYGGYTAWSSWFFNSGGAFTVNSNAGANMDLYGKLENNGSFSATINIDNIALQANAEMNPVLGDLNINAPNIFTNAFTLNVWGNNKTLTFGTNTVISGTGQLRINQSSTVVLQAVQTYTGLTTINAGTLSLTGGDNRLVTTNDLTFGGSATLNLGGNSQTLRTINEFVGGTSYVTNGSLTLNGDVDFGVDGAANSGFDASGLTNFTYNRSNRHFRVRPATTSGMVTADLLLARTGVGSNTITAGSITIGAASGTSQGSNHIGRLGLGVQNTLRTGGLSVGGFNGAGSIGFQSGISNGVLTLRDTAGTGSISTVVIGETSSGDVNRLGNATVNLNGGTLDGFVASMVVGRQNANGNTNVTAVLTMPAGTLTANNLTIGDKTNTTGAPVMTGTFSQGGGNVTVGTLTFGLNANATATPNHQVVYALNGGVLSAGSITGGTGLYNTSTRRTLLINGGNLTHATGTDLTLAGTNNTDDGGRLIFAIGSGGGTMEAATGRTITLASSVLLNNSGTPGTLTKIGAGTLALGNAGSFTGSTSMTAGFLRLNATSALAGSTVDYTGGAIVFDSSVTGVPPIFSLGGITGNRPLVVQNNATTPAAIRVQLGTNGSSTTYGGAISGLSGSEISKFSTGSLELTGGLTTISARVRNGTLSFSGTGYAGNGLTVGFNENVTSTANWNAFGTFNSVLVNDQGASAFSTLRVNGGSLTVTGTASPGAYPWYNDSFIVAGKGAGTVEMSGGTLNLASNKRVILAGLPRFGGNIASAPYPHQGLFNLTGGLVDVQGSGDNNLFWLAYAQNLRDSTQFSATGTLLLAGGTFQTSRTIKDFTDTSGTGAIPTATSYVVLNGGSLRAGSAANANWIDASVDSVTLNAGGGTFDTNGQDMGITRAIGGTGNLRKGGTGTLSLSGNNNYSGTTTVSAGTLLVNGTHTGGDNYTVAGNAALGGTGQINLAASKSLSVGANGVLAPGASIGTLTVDATSFTLSADSILAIEVDNQTTPNTVTNADQLRLGSSASSIDITNAVLRFDFLSATTGTVTQASPLVIVRNDSSSAVTGSFKGMPRGGVADKFEQLTGSLQFKLYYSYDAGSNSYTGGNDIAIEFSAVPEPGALGLLGAGSLAIQRRRRRAR